MGQPLGNLFFTFLLPGLQSVMNWIRLIPTLNGLTATALTFENVVNNILNYHYVLLF